METLLDIYTSMPFLFVAGVCLILALCFTSWSFYCGDHKLDYQDDREEQAMLNGMWLASAGPFIFGLEYLTRLAPNVVATTGDDAPVILLGALMTMMGVTLFSVACAMIGGGLLYYTGKLIKNKIHRHARVWGESK